MPLCNSCAGTFFFSFGKQKKKFHFKKSFRVPSTFKHIHCFFFSTLLMASLVAKSDGPAAASELIHHSDRDFNWLSSFMVI